MKLTTLFTLFAAILSAGALPSQLEAGSSVGEFGGPSALRTANTNLIGIAKIEEIVGIDVRDEAAVDDFLQKRQAGTNFGLIGCPEFNLEGACFYVSCPNSFTCCVVKSDLFNNPTNVYPSLKSVMPPRLPLVNRGIDRVSLWTTCNCFSTGVYYCQNLLVGLGYNIQGGVPDGWSSFGKTQNLCPAL